MLLSQHIYFHGSMPYLKLCQHLQKKIPIYMMHFLTSNFDRKYWHFVYCKFDRSKKSCMDLFVGEVTWKTCNFLTNKYFLRIQNYRRLDYLMWHFPHFLSMVVEANSQQLILTKIAWHYLKFCSVFLQN